PIRLREAVVRLVIGGTTDNKNAPRQMPRSIFAFCSERQLAARNDQTVRSCSMLRAARVAESKRREGSPSDSHIHETSFSADATNASSHTLAAVCVAGTAPGRVGDSLKRRRAIVPCQAMIKSRPSASESNGPRNHAMVIATGP